jgi:hypothetical protein
MEAPLKKAVPNRALEGRRIFREHGMGYLKNI